MYGVLDLGWSIREVRCKVEGSAQHYTKPSEMCVIHPQVRRIGCTNTDSGIGIMPCTNEDFLLVGTGARGEEN